MGGAENSPVYVVCMHKNPSSNPRPHMILVYCRVTSVYLCRLCGYFGGTFGTYIFHSYNYFNSRTGIKRSLSIFTYYMSYMQLCFTGLFNRPKTQRYQNPILMQHVFSCWPIEVSKNLRDVNLNRSTDTESL